MRRMVGIDTDSAEEERTSAGTVIDGRFVLLRRLGRGGAATVWLAEDSAVGDRVAVKLAHRHLRDSKKALERFAREAEVMTSLQHPNIVQCRVFELDAIVPYIAMDYIPGHALKQEIGARSPTDRHFTTDFVKRIMGELSAAVSYAHERRILHRDLNPANVLLDTNAVEMSVRVADFGVAKMVDADLSRATTHGRIIGTPASIAPEQALGEELDLRADIFALGVLIFEVLTLRRAWILTVDGDYHRAYDGPIPATQHNTPLAVFKRILEAARPDIRDVRPELPDVLAEVVTTAMAIDPDDRFSTVTDLYDALVRSLEGVVLADPSATFVLPRASRRGSTVAPPTVTSPEEAPDTRVDVAPTPILTAPVNVLNTPSLPSPPSLLNRPSVLGLLLVVASVGLGGAAFVASRTPTVIESEPVPAPAAAARVAPIAVATKTPPTENERLPRPVETPAHDGRKARGARQRPDSAPPRAETPPAETAPRPAAPAFPEVKKLLARVRNDPSDADAIQALVAAIGTASARVEDEAVRRRIRRIAGQSGHQADVDGLAGVVRDLEAAAR